MVMFKMLWKYIKKKHTQKKVCLRMRGNNLFEYTLNLSWLSENFETQDKYIY